MIGKNGTRKYQDLTTFYILLALMKARLASFEKMDGGCLS